MSWEKFLPFLNLLLLLIIPYLSKVEHRLTKLETKFDLCIKNAPAKEK